MARKSKKEEITKQDILNHLEREFGEEEEVPFTKEEFLILLELARAALELDYYEVAAGKLDLSDTVLIPLRDKLEAYLEENVKK